MRDELLGYYERELSYLRELGSEFADKYPRIATRLMLDPAGSPDPHVERLIEAVAFLTARIRLKLDDDLPELTDSLLGILYPHYLAPVPSMAIVQLHADPDEAKLTTGHDVPRHTALATRPVRGVRCRFRTCYPVTLWPLAVVDAAVEMPPVESPLGGARDFAARALVRIRLKTFGGLPWSSLGVPSLRVFLHGETALAAGLYEMLCAGVTQVEVHPTARGATRGQPVVLPRGSIRPVGFDRDHITLPYPGNAFPAYALLQEYFTFPQKFLFVDLANLDRATAVTSGDEIELRIFCSQARALDQNVQASTFRLGCTPVINLFEKSAEPIWLDHTKVEYRVVPDVHGPWAHEVFSIDAVTAAGERMGEVRPLEPFYAVRHGSGDQQAFWTATRRPALDGATEVYLSAVDRDFSPAVPATETLSLRITCTNRDLVVQIPFSGTVGGDLVGETLQPFVKPQCLGKPTPPRRRQPGRGAHWHLISHLSLNHLSLAEQGPDALQGVLELYDFGDTPATRRQIAAITRVTSERVVRNVRGAFCRGLRVRLGLEREGFVGAGAYLFAAVIERFLGLYTHLNSFVELVAEVDGEEQPLHRWPPRAGEQILL